MTTAARFRQEDVRRAVRGFLAGGAPLGKLRILPDGSIEVYAAGAPGESAAGGNPLDRLLDNRECGS